MWTWKHHALALALAGASAGAQALDLIDVWQAAREHDAAYASARASWEAGQEKTIQGRAPLLPQLNASGDYTRNKAERPAGIGRYRSASAGLRAFSPICSAHPQPRISTETRNRRRRKIGRSTLNVRGSTTFHRMSRRGNLPPIRARLGGVPRARR